jgi:hypothetical protein
MNKTLEGLLEEKEKIWNRLFEVRGNPNLPKKDMEIQLKALDERFGAIQEEIMELKFKQPGIGSYRMYY